MTPDQPHPSTAARTTSDPYGIAPVAVDPTAWPPRRRSLRLRILNAAVVSSALATIPVAAVWSRVDDRAAAPTLDEAVAQLEAAGDETSVRATAAALRASNQRRVVAEASGSAAPAGGTALAGAPLPATGAETVARPAAGPAASASPAADAPTTARTVAEADPATPLLAAAEAADATELTPVARGAGVDLLSLSTETVLVGFHEAAGPGTETLESLAPLAVALNDEETPLGVGASEEQVAPVMELPTRDRGRAASSAVDVAVPAWEDIYAPVSGTVVEAAPYTLYGEFADNRIAIEPDGHPGVHVVMVHIGEVEVRPGDRVVAGETVVAGTAKQFPFASQIDRFAEEVSGRAHPHVHVEVKRV